MNDQDSVTPFSGMTADLQRAHQDGQHGVTVHDSSVSDAHELLTDLAPDNRGWLGWLGPYRVLRMLGCGAMGVVFLAEDTGLCRPVALKVMRPAVARNAAARQGFLREARVAAQIEHDHIVTTYHVGEDRGIPYLAMQLLRGGSLATWLAQGHRPTPRQAVRMVREAALGLAAAHARGLIHRDIKPSNLWLETRTVKCSPEESGSSLLPVRVRLLEFGLAQAINSANLTRLGLRIGTVAYLSPEQVLGRDVDDRSDLFSLGCVLYRLCTGALPFGGDDRRALLTAIVHQTPCPVRQLNAEVPPVLAELIERLLAKDRGQRPSSARALAAELHGIERVLGGGARSLRPLAPFVPRSMQGAMGWSRTG